MPNTNTTTERRSLEQIIKALPGAYDTAVNAAYNDGWNDAVEQCAKMVNAARSESRDLRSVVSEIKALKQETQ